MKLSLRELFLLVALVAMGCGWFIHQRRLTLALAETKQDLDFIWLRTQHAENSRDTLKKALENRGFTVGISMQTGEATVVDPKTQP
jgi:hypothetical protein